MIHSLIWIQGSIDVYWCYASSLPKKKDVLIEGHVHVHGRLQQFGLHRVMAQDVHWQRFNQLPGHADQPGDVHLVSNEALAIEARAVEDPEPQRATKDHQKNDLKTEKMV